jgi:hypothetical protein
MGMNKKVLLLGACGILGVSGALGAYSLYNGVSDKKVNTFNIEAGEKGAKVGTISEDSWDAEAAKNLQPGATVAKDPVFTSTADYESWVIMRVEIPYTACLIGTQTGDAVEQLPIYITDSDSDAVTVSEVTGLANEGTYVTKINKNWQYLGQSDSSDGKSCYFYYGYKTIVGKRDASDSSTTALFTNFVVKDLTKLDKAFTGNLNISANIIQSEGIDDIEAAWAKVNNSTWVDADESDDYGLSGSNSGVDFGEIDISGDI